jgi:excisionase family DNA binding protein
MCGLVDVYTSDRTTRMQQMSTSAASPPSIAEVPAPLLTVAEVASTLRVDVTTVYRYIRSGTLGCVRFGGSVRVPVSELREFLNAEKVTE